MSAVIAMGIAEAARGLGAVVPATAADARFHGVCSDSRQVRAGQLFIALRGPTFDGHDFVAGAAASGAAAALVSKRIEVPIAQIVVGDTLAAYGRLAQLWRSRFAIPTIALTGSNGKTTVKEMLRAILIEHTGTADAVLATEGNLNNAIGVPQMMCGLTHRHRVAVFEMGMNHRHEIDYLTRLVVPDVALVIMAGSAHIGELGSREAIAEAKGEIYGGLGARGTACVNLDDRFAGYWRGLVGDRRLVTFGAAVGADVRGEPHGDGLRLGIGGAVRDVRLRVAGEHNRRNAIAAAAGAHALGVPLAAIVAGLGAFEGVAGRLRTYPGHHSATIIDDTYNANPDSMHAAIATLAGRPGQRILVLGDMGELGSGAAAMHREVGAAAKAAGIDALLAIGDMARQYADAFGVGATHYAELDALLADLAPRLAADATVLVKGSRFMRMERVVEKIAVGYSKGAH